MILPIILLLFVMLVSTLAFILLKIPSWEAQVHNNLGAMWFTLRVIGSLLMPLVIGIGIIVLVYRIGLDFARAIYNLPPTTHLFPLIHRRLVGVPPLPPPLDTLWKYPFVTIKDPKDLPEDHWVRWLGGPATLVIYDGVALYLERGNRFSRVVGPGSPPMPFLDRYETVKAVVDLRPQTKEGETHPWTKDGIQVHVKIRMECQIYAGKEAIQASKNLVYPFDPQAVKQAVEYTAVKLDKERNRLYESDWLDGVWGQVTGYINRHISGHTIDEISLFEHEETHGVDGNLQVHALAQRHLEAINRSLFERNTGAKVLAIHLAIDFPPEVNQYRVKYWEAERARRAAVRLSQAEADSIRLREEARARTEEDILNAITEKLKDVPPDNLTEPLLMSLTGILDNTLNDPLIRPIIARNSLNLLEQLRNLLKNRF
ncbi:MAG: hypothetical protein NZL98_05050 [Anaerolineales bacterium]|nr:hypothetical protein [Anaerolineales bacterium]MDW8228015.1 hypothetical protein [Anaerolineales bacterium]